MQQDFFGKLMDVFRVCEDLENMDGLHMIYKIVKGISQYLLLCHFNLSLCWHFFVHFLYMFVSLAVLLNSTQIFERIFSDEFMMDIIVALKCEFITWFSLQPCKMSFLVLAFEHILCYTCVRPCVCSDCTIVKKTLKMSFLESHVILDDPKVSHITVNS